MAVYNVDKISDWYDAFISAKNKFNNTYYEAYKSSYISSCSDSTINKIRYVLNSHYGRIYRIYNNINKVWSRYLEDLKNTDNRLAGGKGGINASSVSAKLSKLPELKDYKRDLSVRIKSASAVIGINGDNKLNDLKNNYDSFNEYTGARASTWLNSIFGNLNDSLKDTGAKISGLFKDNNSNNQDSKLDAASAGNPDNDKKIHFKNVTLLDEKGTYVVYDHKETDAFGITRYYDENGNVFKICYADGSYEIKDYSNDFYYDIDGKKHEVGRSYSDIVLWDLLGEYNESGGGTLSHDIQIKNNANLTIKYNKDGSLEYLDGDKVLLKVYSDGTKEKYTYNYGFSNSIKIEYKYNDGSSETKVNGETTSKIDKNGTEYKYSFKGGYHLDEVIKSNGEEIKYYDNGKIYRETFSDGTVKEYYKTGDISYEKKSNGDEYYYRDNYDQIIHSDGTSEIKEYLTGGKYKGYYIYRKNTKMNSTIPGTLCDANGNKVADNVTKAGKKIYSDGRMSDLINIDGKVVEY